MNKKVERFCLDAVFRGASFHVTEAEEPDFLCCATSGFEFGVEVTDFFRTESDARLARIQGYATDLLAGGISRHKDDIDGIRVEDVIYMPSQTGKEIRLKAIPREVPGHMMTVPILLRLIAKKNQKHVRYADQITPVDLIVNDVDEMLRFEMVRDILFPMFDQTELRCSPFREIYLLTLRPT
ncbi:hypothetical protein GC163_22210 [bacterium]|nr:hypothetical protein [bacterium]